MNTRNNFQTGVAGLVIILALSACGPNTTNRAASDACDYFFSLLDGAPHLNLTRGDGTYQSLWDGQSYDGCEIGFETNVALTAGRRTPDIVVAETTEMYQLEWRENNLFTADGPGTGSFRIEKETTLCLVRHEQPAHLGDDGSIVQSDTMRITIQCRDKS